MNIEFPMVKDAVSIVTNAVRIILAAIKTDKVTQNIDELIGYRQFTKSYYCILAINASAQ